MFPYFPYTQILRSIKQESQSRTRGYIDLVNGTIYFDTDQYQCTVLGLPLFYIFNIYI